MEWMIDTADLTKIKELIEYYPICGVTSNPSIVKKAAPQDFFAHMREIRKCIGKERSLHIQVTARTAEDMLAEARLIHEKVDDAVYIKIPVTKEGLKAIKLLKEAGFRVTATAIYTEMQAYLAMCAGADYLALYINRIANLDHDPMIVVEHVAAAIHAHQADCQILGASYKNLSQVQETLVHGAAAVTVPADILPLTFANPSIEQAVEGFERDWFSLYGEGNDLLKMGKEQ